MILVAVWMFIGADAAAQAQRELTLQQWRQANERRLSRSSSAFLRIPNLPREPVDMRRNATFIQAMLTERGVATQLLEMPDAPPVVFGELRVTGATRTLVFYSHYDGQPVIPPAWSNQSPFNPELQNAAGQPVAIDTAGPLDPEWRVQARSASDAKAPIMAMVSALDALRASGRMPAVNVKFFIDGEEESGSPPRGS